MRAFECGMRQSRRLYTIIMAIALSSSAFAQCPNAQDPALKSSSGIPDVACEALDETFLDFSQSCKLPYPLALQKHGMIHNSTTTVSVVPDELITSVRRLNLQHPTSIPQNIGLSRLLSQVFPRQSLSSLVLSDYIGATAGKAASGLSQVNIDAAAYSTSCQATIAANANLKADFSFPPATIASSLSASLQSNSKSGLLIAVGTFDSPLWSFASAANGSLYGNLLMLAWRTNSNKPTTPLYYLAHARALTSSQLSSSQYYSDVSFNASLNAGFFSVSTQSSAQLARSVSTQLSTSFFNTVVDQPVQSDFVAIPALADLQSAISKTQLPPATVSTTTLVHANDSAHFTQNVPGIPQDICGGQDTTIWSVSDSNAAQISWKVVPGSLHTSSGIADDNGVPSCSFVFDLQSIANPPQDFIAAPVITGKYVGTSFSFTMSAVPFSASLYPQFGSRVIYSDAGVLKVISGAQVLDYMIPIPVVQAASGSGYNSMSWAPGRIQANCANGTTIALVPPDLDPLGITTTGTSLPDAHLDFATADARGPIDSSDANPVACTISSGTLAFSDTSGALPAVNRDLTATIGLTVHLPHVKPNLVLSPPTISNGKAVFIGTIQGVSDLSLLSKSTVSLSEGSATLATGTIANDFSVSFPPVSLDPKMAHTITLAVSASPLVSAATATPIQVPAAQQ